MGRLGQTMTHPSIQPRLDRSNVTTMLNYLVAERDEADRQVADLRAAGEYMAAAERACYAQGLDRAVEVVTDMWTAAVIATAALADELDALADEEVEDDD
mgnify:CR=1 FL=1